jgi:hypothetical protein
LSNPRSFAVVFATDLFNPRSFAAPSPRRCLTRTFAARAPSHGFDFDLDFDFDFDFCF